MLLTSTATKYSVRFLWEERKSFLINDITKTSVLNKKQQPKQGRFHPPIALPSVCDFKQASGDLMSELREPSPAAEEPGAGATKQTMFHIQLPECRTLL